MMIAMSIDCMATKMQIRLEVSHIGKSHQVDAFGSTMSSWFRRKQSSVSLSMTEAEYIADFSAKL